MARRDNRQGQSDRSKGGNAFENEFRRIVQSWLEDEGLDDEFDLIKKKRYSYLFRGAAEPYLLKPDLTIVHAATETVVIHGGAKISLRERYKQDALESLFLREIHPQSIYIEAFARENEGDSAEAIGQKLNPIRQQFVPYFFATLMSTRIPESMDIAKQVVVQHLRGWEIADACR